VNGDNNIRIVSIAGDSPLKVVIGVTTTVMKTNVIIITKEIIMIIMLKIRDHISELRPPTGRFFIPQVIHVHRKQWWNDINGGNY
jgi:hypothetical protein